MAFNLPDYWVWDFWFAQDGDLTHLYYLHAPKSLGNPDLRHRNARIGHATSKDLVSWQDHGRIFDAGAAGTFDGSATWTGSVVRDDAGLWRMFYTGSRFLAPDTFANVETVGQAMSEDLYTWTKQPGPVCSADPHLYETLGTSSWPEEAWRDPWVFRGADGLWHMLITGRGKQGDEPDRGVMGHATSPDLDTWTVQPALSAAGSGFAHLEVFQVVEIDGQNHIVFCCDAAKLCGSRAGQTGGVWTMPVEAMPSEVDFKKARLLVPEALYAGRIAFGAHGQPLLLAFNNVTRDGQFSGGISDPLPLSIDADGYLVVKG
ncbi:glycoside hydrolase family 68 protein [Devosia chinhatensis]|uniref:Glycosyl hydrolase family 32 n=1 Tax=Devosia chinhatensis TaxID=429727 RepID=A0A0F5FJ77_9HYPH|nr:glycoside hydrolase family 68 protein [Devosia chinhatensis]KKB08605.1 glycosyl hydrolase family 32 [Devosia chinhatensis]